jgi:hypothetical protein
LRTKKGQIFFGLLRSAPTDPRKSLRIAPMTERERPPQFQSDSEDEYPMQEVRKKKKRRRQNPNGQPEPNVAFEEPPKDIQLDVDTRQSNAELRKRHTRQKSVRPFLCFAAAFTRSNHFMWI